jgi:hypothetical protein
VSPVSGGIQACECGWCAGGQGFVPAGHPLPTLDCPHHSVDSRGIRASEVVSGVLTLERAYTEAEQSRLRRQFVVEMMRPGGYMVLPEPRMQFTPLPEPEPRVRPWVTADAETDRAVTRVAADWVSDPAPITDKTIADLERDVWVELTRDRRSGVGKRENR